ncbi:hypothetical protein [Eubacterium limosum]|uniref:hypothetical protein n=1 Tax=Eubacterium limosum TaxID=1736 RepID=UPI0010627637|nr:hypothetical protein [Eubacterium limosum]
MKKAEGSAAFTHWDYRKAKVVHLVNREQDVRFYHQGKPITKEEADTITQRYMVTRKIKSGIKR